MKDFSFSVLFAIVRDMLGVDPWIVLGLLAVVAAGFLISLSRHGLRGPQFRTAAVTGIVGGLVAIGTAPMLTAASFENIRGTLDWVSLLLIGFAAGGGIAFFTFAALGLSTPRREA